MEEIIALDFRRACDQIYVPSRCSPGQAAGYRGDQKVWPFSRRFEPRDVIPINGRGEAVRWESVRASEENWMVFIQRSLHLVGFGKRRIMQARLCQFRELPVRHRVHGTVLTARPWFVEATNATLVLVPP
jgi:hypothetical protein